MNKLFFIAVGSFFIFGKGQAKEMSKVRHPSSSAQDCHDDAVQYIKNKNLQGARVVDDGIDEFAVISYFKVKFQDGSEKTLSFNDDGSCTNPQLK